MEKGSMVLHMDADLAIGLWMSVEEDDEKLCNGCHKPCWVVKRAGFGTSLADSPQLLLYYAVVAFASSWYDS